MYGGIHYRAAIDVGLSQGQTLGEYVINKLSVMTNKEVASTSVK